MHSVDGEKADLPGAEVLEIDGDTFDVVSDGMWSAVNGPRATIGVLKSDKTTVAAKTGTAEFGALNEEGVYEHTHSWVTGFFPAEDPKYSFVYLLEDGGESINASREARKLIDWVVDEYEL